MLCIKGKMKKIMAVGNNSGTPAAETFDWNDTLIDSGIIAGLTFFASLAGGNIVGLPSIMTLYSSGVTALIQFFTMLAIKRGIKK